ncbi:restriction endonuclease [Kluyvera intermedia]|uniref:Restriction endonuclease n=1 Tax=Kluyvera intermedia TaxID=61648 RepID=A0AA95FYZ7_KLUIN|nr:restriction endonuclease [Kluyvera intermedia]WGL54616.1 restriction endonuclease [Kluyvera intermedia]
MKEYDFRALNDKEFERLTIDLLSQREKTTIERFKPGRDGGIDGYYFSSEVVIIQAKHYVNTGYKGLLRTLRNEELDKVKKINPDRYIIITSVGLSPANKQEIMNLFSPFIINTNDIIGQEGINDLITNYPDVEKNHYKLWLSSSNILIELLNNGPIQKRNFLIEQAVKDSYKYIETRQLRNTVEILDKSNVVIVTGLPGVGKTTLAKQVALIYCNGGYEVYHIEDSITDIESVYLKEKKQFFYFDDFLGANHLEIFSGNSDSKIVNFIKRIISDKNKKMILTSRTNILNRAKNLSEIFNIEKIEKKEFEINVSDLTDIEKAEILYNHIWHSSLPTQYSDVYYNNRNYWKIIHHKNFNPRLISFITDNDRVSNIDISCYWSYIEESLNNPEAIWSHCFNNQIPEEVLDLVCLVVFSANNINEYDCKSALKQVFEKKYPSDYYIKINKIDSYIKESLKSTLNRTIITTSAAPQIKLSPFNPSVSDYIINRFSTNEIALSLYFTALKTIQSVSTLFSLRSNGKINAEVFITVLTSLITEVKSGKLDDYAIHLYNQIIKSGLILKNKNKMVSPDLFLTINEEYLSYDYKVGECVLWAVKNNPSLFSEQFIADFIYYALRSSWAYTLNHDDYMPLAKLIQLYPDIKNEDITITLMEHIKDFWHENYDEYLANTGKIQALYEDDIARADDIAYETLSNLISEYNFPFGDDDIEYMFENVDTSSHMMSSYDHDDEERHTFREHISNRENSESYINDLFKKR